MAAITDLTTAASVATGDYLVISQSGTDKKATKATLLASAVPVSPTAINIASNAVTLFSSFTSLTFGILLITESNTGHSAIFALRGGYNQVVKISESGSAFSATKDNASTLNVYYDTGYKIQNKTASTLAFYATILGV